MLSTSIGRATTQKSPDRKVNQKFAFWYPHGTHSQIDIEPFLPKLLYLLVPLPRLERGTPRSTI